MQIRNPQRLGVGVLVLLAAMSSTSWSQIRWKHGQQTTVPPMTRAELRESLASLSGRENRRRVVIHFNAPLESVQRSRLQADGIQILSYLGGRAYFATLGENVDFRRIASNSHVVAVEPIRTVYKLHPDLVAGIVQPWSIISGAEGSLVAAYVWFHPDVENATS